MAIDDGKMELYKYVQQEYATLIDARGGQKTRLGLFLVVTGFLVTLAFTFAMPTLVASVDRAESLSDKYTTAATVVALIPVPIMIWLLWYLTGAVRAIIDTLSHVRLNTIGIDADKIKAALNTKELSGD